MRIVQVTWLDAQDHADKWADVADVEAWGGEDCAILSVGFVVKETDRYLTIAGDFDASDSDLGRVTKIPRKMILHVEDLTASPHSPQL